MPSIELAPGEEVLTGSAGAMCSPVSGVNAHLRRIPRDPSDFQLVVTFHHANGSLGEAELNPIGATGLVSEIACVIDQGNGRELRKGTALDTGACMADDLQHPALGRVKAAVDRQSPTADPNGNAPTGEPPGKTRNHRPKLSLRYRSQTFATDL